MVKLPQPESKLIFQMENKRLKSVIFNGKREFYHILEKIECYD